jgi:hypothetical protein
MASIDTGVPPPYIEMGGARYYSLTLSRRSGAKIRDRFHGVVDNPYILPNDEEAEYTRLVQLQAIIRALFEKNILAPIVPLPKRILDCGTGSGYPLSVFV